jgi:pimeloyl-ACP methyl ester carboxylesterase
MSKKACMIAVVLLLLIVLAGRWGTVGGAVEIKEAPNSKAEQNRAPEGAVDSHASHMRFYFQDVEMDFNFGSLVLGSTVNHGCEIGEAFYTAAQIKDGDAASWQEQWLKTARRVEARGEQSLAKGHTVSARDQLQRASYYYRAVLFPMPPDDPQYKEIALKSRALLKKAGKLFEPQVEYIEIPFEGTVLPGYFRKAAAGETPRKTLIMIGGAETFSEDLFFYIAAQAFDRGYNFLTVDLPGQGLLPLERKFLRPAMHIPVKAVVDYALGRRDVDPRRLAVYGYSTGGVIAPQAAMHDKRIKALAMSHCVVDGRAEVVLMPQATSSPDVVKGWSSFKRGVNRAIVWRFGLKTDDFPGLVEANKGFVFDPAKVTVPPLIIVAHGEYQSPEIQRQTKVCMDYLPNPKKKLVITPAEEGASNHCMMENRSLMSQELFDWLDEIFKESKPKQLKSK